MTGLLERPSSGERQSQPAPMAPVGDLAPPGTRPSEDLLLLPILLLLVAASLSLTYAFETTAFVPPVGGALVVALGLSWGMRRLGAGPGLSLLANVLGWLVFVAVGFLDTTALAGLVPTPHTLGGMAELWVQGAQVIRTTPAPVAAGPGVLAITVTSVWAVAHVVDALAFRLRAPIKAIGVALALWALPLAVAPDRGSAWPIAVPFLAAAAVVLLAFVGSGLRRWGVWVQPGPGGGTSTPTRESPRGLSPLTSLGVALAAIAIVLGSAFAGLLPGFGEDAWYEVGGSGSSTTWIDNPIVQIKRNLVDPGDTPLMEVKANQDHYLRLTSLDSYQDGEWKTDGLKGKPVTPGQELKPETPIGLREQRVQIEVEVVGLSNNALVQDALVPAPYHPRKVTSADGVELHYDPDLASLTADSLEQGDRYAVTAKVINKGKSSSDLRDLAALSRDVRERYTRLPPDVPPRVAQKANDIVTDAGVRHGTAFEQAEAIQNVLRGWTYSLRPQQGHSGNDMVDFLDDQKGYCEQYAGTMAVMLRTLNIPARVAVGFTSGDEVEGKDDTYVITEANAHAWVEVLFPDSGWVRFEPTPRSDVLVPGADNIAPQQVTQQGTDPSEESQAEQEEQPSPPQEPEQNPSEPEPAGGGADGGSGGLGWLGLAALVVLVGLAAGVGLWRWRAAGRTSHTPAERVLRAQAEVERVGRGLGCRPAASETDGEYLARLAGASDDAALLAGVTARARYAPALDDEAASEAEASARRLRAELLAGLSSPRRAAVFLRADAAAAVDVLAANARRARLRA